LPQRSPSKLVATSLDHPSEEYPVFRHRHMEPRNPFRPGGWVAASPQSAMASQAKLNASIKPIIELASRAGGVRVGEPIQHSRGCRGPRSLSCVDARTWCGMTTITGSDAAPEPRPPGKIKSGKEQQVWGHAQVSRGGWHQVRLRLHSRAGQDVQGSSASSRRSPLVE
jgi:hypothetical protein